MGEIKDTGIDSRLVVNAKQSYDLFAKEDEGFKQNTVTKMPQFSVEMRYFTVDMRPQSSQQLDYKKARGSFKIEFLKSKEQSRELDDESPINAASTESFHSCHSTISFQEVKPKDTAKGERKTASPSTETGKPKSIPDEELLQQLTMVNAIFLNNSVGECSHGKHSKTAHQESHGEEPNGCKKGSNGGQHSFKYSQNLFNPKSFFCHVDRDSDVSYVNNIYGDNVSTKPFYDDFIYSCPESQSSQWPHKNCNPVINVSTSRDPERKPIDLSSDLNYKNDDKNCCQVPNSKSTVRKRKHAILKPSIIRRGGEIYKIKPSYTSSTCNKPWTPESFENGIKSIVEKRKQTINQAEEINFFQPTYLNNSSVIIHPESKISPEHKQESYFTEDVKVNKPFMNGSDISESKNTKKNIKHNFKTLFSKPETPHFVCESESDIDYFKKEIGDVSSNNYAGHSDMDDSDGIILQTSKSFTRPDELYFQPAFVEDASTRNKSQLSVIEEEEDVESVISYSSADDVEDDYCLTDINGRPIHLFDSRGLPLTDGRGRPLKSAQGKIMMECDQNGIPVADNSSIFDMFGHQPHEEHFDPSRAPKMPVCNKLSTSDGRPLLLYDVEGRPLTSVSGTMLFDSSGRGLVQLTTNVEDV